MKKVHIYDGIGGAVCGGYGHELLVAPKEKWGMIVFWRRCANCQRWFDRNVRGKTPEERRATFRAL